MHDAAQMPERLQAFLRASDPRWASAVVVSYEPMTGGYSRLMAKARVDVDGQSCDCIVRGDPPAGQAAIDTDRDLEWAVLTELTQLGTVPMPAALHYDADGAGLGTKAIVLEWVDGPSLLAHLQTADASTHRAVADELCDAMAAVHGVPADRLPAALPRPTSWDDYFASLIDRWRSAEAAHIERDPFMRYAAAWLEAHPPPPAPLCLVHGDLQSANVLRRADGSLSLVDWEFAHIGDPREDIGWFKTVATVSPPDVIGVDDEAFCARYRERTGLSEEVVNPLTVAYFSVLGAVNVYVNVIGQVAAFARGETTSLTAAYNTGAQAYAHMVWVMATQGLQAVMGGAP